MRRSSVLVAVPLLLVAMLGGAAPTGARQPACDAGDPPVWTWPRRLDAIGTAFTGRPVDTWVNRQGWRVFLFDVLSVKVGGPLPDRVRVRLRCVETRFRVGARYLITSSSGFRRDGVTYFEHSSQEAAAWRVWPTDQVRLMGYGPGTEWENTPRYLDRPETLRQAVRAVTPDQVDEPAAG
jgi:hypothetical protein